MIRPRAARWFELLVARDDTTLALEALAATGAVELETREGAQLPPGFAELGPWLQRFAELAARYRGYWPREGLSPSAVPEPPVQALQRCVALLNAWTQPAEPIIRALQAGAAEREQIMQWREVIVQLDEQLIDLTLAGQAGPQLQVRLAVSPVPIEAPPGGHLLRGFEADGRHFALLVGTAAQLQPLKQITAAAKGQWLAPPPWLARARGDNLEAARLRLASIEIEAAQGLAELARLAELHQLRRVLADVQRLQWVIDNVQGLRSGDLFCWITGWTSADAAALEAAVERSGARALLHHPAAPRGARAPMLLANPAWARPFEVFARAMGMPSDTEADPTRLLAVVVPLMFGYMFGDLGQGLLIAAAGFMLRNRFAIARLFIAGGLSAALFGLLFGGVFGLHTMPALWVHPLDEPLAVLLAPLAGGAMLLVVGLLIAALEAFWRGEFARWLFGEAGLLVSYIGILASPWWPAGLALAIAGVLQFSVGQAWFERRWLAGAAAIGEWVERMLQLLINTLSFARVGAFALAHAGLSSAIVALMEATSHPLTAGLVLVVGNAVVIVLEGLVVSIQTTRLVLFEFFTRFLQAQGRVFRPLPLPPSMSSSPSTS